MTANVEPSMENLNLCVEVLSSLATFSGFPEESEYLALCEELYPNIAPAPHELAAQEYILRKGFFNEPCID